MKINPDAITSVHIIPGSVDPYYAWKDEIKFLGFTIQKEGLYVLGIESDVLIANPEELNNSEHSSFVHRVVFINPCVEIRLSDKSSFRKYFKTLKEAMDFAATFTHLIDVVE